MTDAEVIATVRLRGYPDNLLDAEIADEAASVLREVRTDYPLQTYGSFQTVAGQMIYDLFNPTSVPAIQQGVLPGGLRVLEMIGSPGTITSESDVFGLAPLLQAGVFDFGLTPFTRYSFGTPGDLTLWESNWYDFVRRYGTLFWEPVESRLGGSIRIMPKPESVRTVLVHYTKYRTEDQIRNDDPVMFLDFVESGLCERVANKFSASAGIRIGETSDSGKTRDHWMEQAKNHYDLAVRALERHGFEDISASIRS